MLGIISIIVIWISFFIYLFPWYYASELIISFLPYLIVLNFAWLIYYFIRLRTKKIKEDVAKKSFFSLFLILFGILFLMFSRQYNHFYNWRWFENIDSSTWWVKILFANIHKNNQNYTWIKNLIEKNNPDLIMFVEFSELHYNNMKDFLRTNYPYINSTTWSKKFIGSMVFSKYKIENRATNFQQWMWRYGYFSVKSQNIYFYLVHTSSPDSYEHFVMRNNQLNTLRNDFNKHEKYRSGDNVIMIWDFNISPWSYYYKQLNSSFSWKLTDITRDFPILFTWRLFNAPIFWSHIDYLWVSSWIDIYGLKSVKIPWSDHKGFIFKLTNNN